MSYIPCHVVHLHLSKVASQDKGSVVVGLRLTAREAALMSEYVPVDLPRESKTDGLHGSLQVRYAGDLGLRVLEGCEDRVLVY